MYKDFMLPTVENAKSRNQCFFDRHYWKKHWNSLVLIEWDWFIHVNVSYTLDLLYICKWDVYITKIKSFILWCEVFTDIISVTCAIHLGFYIVTKTIDLDIDGYDVRTLLIIVLKKINFCLVLLALIGIGFAGIWFGNFRVDHW